MQQKFTAVIKKHDKLNAAYIQVPFDVEKVFGAKRVKVKASFDGVEYRGSLVHMGGCYMIGLTQSIRKQIGKNPGDTVKVEVSRDTEERIVEIPDDLKKALKKSGLFEKFKKLSYTHQKEYVQWLNEAKKEDTRKKRLEKTILMIIKNN